MHPFSTSRKNQKTSWFSDVFGGRERVHWEKTGLRCAFTNNFEKAFVIWTLTSKFSVYTNKIYLITATILYSE